MSTGLDSNSPTKPHMLVTIIVSTNTLNTWIVNTQKMILHQLCYCFCTLDILQQAIYGPEGY